VTGIVSDYTTVPPLVRFRPEQAFRSLQNAFKAIQIVALTASLSSCAGLAHVKGWFSHEPTPQPVVEKPVQPVQPVVQAPRPKPQVREPIRAEKPERLASIDPNSLIGLEPVAVEKLLGAPSRANKSEMSLVWTYAGAGCSFQIFFYPDLKTTAFHVLKYGGIDSNGGQIMTSHICVQDILTAKSNAPG
jgi:hypothetical protein